MEETRPLSWDCSPEDFPIQIVKVNPDNTFSLDETALQNILLHPLIKDRYVCVISIAGAFRQGKSFLLNFLLRYLYLQCERSENVYDWLDSRHGPLKGFSWKGGSQRHTLGIVMWSKIFLKRLPNGDEVAIILMDTQGTFDNESTYNDCATIFAMSTLISSLQIYNVMQNIKQDDLAHLECFAGYGNCVKNDAFPFQNLFFLVRDWAWPFEKPYGFQGGEQKLAEILDIQENMRGEVKNRRRNIRELFKKIQCFLMPKPGSAVSEHEAFDGDIENIDSEFLNQMKKLVPFLVDVRNLEVKRINGEKITARSLYEYIMAYTKVFTNDEMPQIESMYMATAEANHQTAIFESFSIYTKAMEEVYSDNSTALNETDLENKHLNSQLRAINHFQNKRKIGTMNMTEKYKQQLLDKIEEAFSKYKKTNEIKQREEVLSVEAKNKEIIQSVIDLYKRLMEDVFKVDNYLEQSQFISKEAEIKRKVIAFYYEKTQEATLAVRQSCFKELENNLTALFKDYESTNCLKEQVSKGETEKALRELVDQIKAAYERNMEKLFEENGFLEESKFETLHQHEKLELLRNYHSQTKDADKNLHEKYLTLLEKNFDNLFSVFKDKNNAKMLMEMKHVTTVKEKAENDYRKLMHGVFGDNNLDFDEASLKEHHRKAKQQVFSTFIDSLKSKDIAKQEIPDLEKRLNAVFFEFKEINEKNRKENQKKIEEIFENLSSQLSNQYNNSMMQVFQAKNLTFCKDDELLEIHRDISKKLISEYQGKAKKVNARNCETHLNNFEEKLNALYKEHLKRYESMRQQYLTRVDNEFFKIYHQAKSIYDKTMSNVLNLTINLNLSSEELQKRYENAKNVAMESYAKGEAVLGSNEISVKYKDKLLEDIESVYNDCLRRLNISSTKEMREINEKQVRTILNESMKIYRKCMQSLLQDTKFLEHSQFLQKNNEAKTKTLNFYQKEMSSFGKEASDKYLKSIENVINVSFAGFKEINDARGDYEMNNAEMICLNAFCEARGFMRLLGESIEHNNHINECEILEQYQSHRNTVLEDFRSKIPKNFENVSKKIEKQLIEFIDRNRKFKVKNDSEE